jgi:hypothetical protein
MLAGGCRPSRERNAPKFTAERRGRNMKQHRPGLAGARELEAIEHSQPWICILVGFDNAFDQRCRDRGLRELLLA